MSEKQYMLSDFDSEVEMLEKINEQQAIINQQKETIDYMNERITELLAYIKHLKKGTERVKEIDGKIFIMM